MSGRRFSRADIPQSIPTLLGDATVAVVIAPHVDRGLQPLWDIARAAATRRRVVVVDLCLRQPRLAEPGPGVTDAFLAEVPLNDVVREVGADLYLIGAGAPVADPDRLWTHERWKRLARGFRQEAALLLLVAPPEALGKLPVTPEIVVALTTEDVASAADAGIALDRVLALEPELTPRPPAPPRPRSEPATPPKRVRPSFIGRLSRPAGRLGTVMRPRERRGSALIVAGAASALIALGLGAFVLWPRRGPESVDARPSDARAGAPSAARGDSLYYSVQVAAYQAEAQANTQARSYEDAGFTAIVTPVRLGRQGVWYRLLVGAEPSPGAAERRLNALWERSLVERPNGTILRTPHALRVGRYPSRPAARAANQALRQVGLAGYIVDTPSGVELLVGAFESPEQAALADSILAANGQPGTLVTRVGIVR